jgi:hypothetical protein
MGVVGVGIGGVGASEAEFVLDLYRLSRDIDSLWILVTARVRNSPLCLLTRRIDATVCVCVCVCVCARARARACRDTHTLSFSL